MKRILVVLLVFIAVFIYVWDTHLFVAGYLGKTGQGPKTIIHQNFRDDLPRFPEVRFAEKGRSPFIAFKPSIKPALKSGTTVKKPSSSSISIVPPPIKINGIMWNPTNPVAIINFNDGTSTIAKIGQMLQGGITIKNIEKNQVEIVYSGKSFILKKM
jgi:hypothetical protein